ncbi:MAG: 6-hydroxymethylpterin diphosphokinase MptE-like protein [Bacilli bacterium]
MINIKLISTKENHMPTIEANVEGKSLYLYSKYNPKRDSQAFAEAAYEKGVNNYLIYGLGLGYHINSLVKLIGNEDYHIYVFECNEDILKLEHESITDLKGNNNITVVGIDSTNSFFHELRKALSIDNIKLVVHNPSLQIIPEKYRDLRYLLEEFIINKESMESIADSLDNNFNENINNFDLYVDELFDKYVNKALFIVSAGPSLDKNIGDLSKKQNGGIILSVGRAAKGLVAAGITPNYIILTDPSKHLFNSQLKGLDVNVPIIVLSTADKNIMKNYKGTKYIALQKGYELAEKYAKKNDNTLVRTGGSVATTALDIGIKMGCNPIVFVGQDLGFTDNRSHSGMARSRNIVQSGGLRDIEDIYGNTIQTSKNLYIYLRWIQNRIAEEKDIEFIDATEGGARIRGTKVMKLKDV